MSDFVVLMFVVIMVFSAVVVGCILLVDRKVSKKEEESWRKDVE